MRLEELRCVLGSSLAALSLPRSGEIRVSCATFVRGLPEALACRAGDAVLLLPVGDDPGQLDPMLSAVAERHAAVLLIPPALAAHLTFVETHNLAIGVLAPGADPFAVANLINRAAGESRPAPSHRRLFVTDSLQELVDILGHLLSKPVAITTPTDSVLGFTPVTVGVDRIRWEGILRRRSDPRLLEWMQREGLLAILFASSHPIRVPGNSALDFTGRLAIRIAWNDEVLGVIWVVDDENSLGEREYPVIEQAAEAAAALMSQQRAAHGWEADLLDDVVHGRIRAAEDMREEAGLYHRDIDSLHQAIYVTVDTSTWLRAGSAHGALEQRQIYARLAEIVRLETLAVDHGAVVGDLSGGMLALFDTKHDDPAGRKQTAMTLAERIAAAVPALQSGLTVSVGVGTDCASFEHITQSYREAEVAARLATSILGGNRAVHYDDLGIYRILLAVRDHRNAIPSGIQRLREYDRRHGSDYLETLATYFDQMGRLTPVAQRLGIHRNTLEYRISRIEEIAGVKLTDTNTRLALELALKLLELEMATGPVDQDTAENRSRAKRPIG